MVQTNDGSEIAEVDLNYVVRWSYELQQSGVLNLQIRWFGSGQRYFALARNYALKLLKEDSGMQNQNMQLCVLFLLKWLKKKISELH
jgi:ATP-dependent DNA helicase RecG